MFLLPFHVKPGTTFPLPPPPARSLHLWELAFWGEVGVTDCTKYFKSRIIIYSDEYCKGSATGLRAPDYGPLG